MIISEKFCAYAKINLALLVGERIAPQGFHVLDSIFARLGLHDSLFINAVIGEGNANGIHINCRFDYRLAEHLHFANRNEIELKSEIEGKDGLLFKTCLKVLEYIGGEFPDFYIRLDLLKSIPSEAGLGGGSADAAVVLNFFSKHFNLSEEAVVKIAEEIGFDVRPCLYKGLSYSYYDGQHHTSPLLFPEGASRRYALILKPPIGSNTRLAYQALGRGEVDQKDLISRLISDREVETLLDKIFNDSIVPSHPKCQLIENDFQGSVFKEIPELESVLLNLNQYNPILSGLSGSGSSIFSLFKDYKTATKAHHAMTNLSEKGWFIAISQLLSL